MKKGTDATNKEQTQIRMDQALKKRIRKYQVIFEKENGVNISFSSATRILVEKQLDVLHIQ